MAHLGGTEPGKTMPPFLTLPSETQISPDPTRGDWGSTFEGLHSKALPACLHMRRAPEQDNRIVPCSHIRWGKDDCGEGSRECPSPSSWDLEVCRETFLEEGPELWHVERALPGKSARQSYEGKGPCMLGLLSDRAA